MPKIIYMPKIGVNMEEALIVEFAVKEGDEVKEGATVLVAETDKANQDIPSTEEGLVYRILVKVGDVVQCQKPIAVLVDKNEILPPDFDFDSFIKKGFSDAGGKTGDSPVDKAKPGREKAPPEGGAPNAHVDITPIARRLAKENNVDLSKIKISPSKGRIGKEEILKYLEDREAESANVQRAIPLSGIRKIISNKMSLSAREYPQAVLSLRVRVAGVFDLIKKRSSGTDTIGFTSALVFFTARALEKHMMLNATLRENAIVMQDDINIGVAVDSGKGLVVPVIHQANRKSLEAIDQELKQKINAVRENIIKTEDLTDGTFTITNLGMFGIEAFIPLVNPPECAILGVGAAIDEVVPDMQAKSFVITKLMNLMLAFDHRINDGTPAARFLGTLKNMLESA